MSKAKIKKIDLDKIPDVLSKAVALIDRELNLLVSKDTLNFDDAKNLIAYAASLTNIYKDHRTQIAEIQKELKTKTKEEILQIVHAEQQKKAS